MTPIFQAQLYTASSVDQNVVLGGQRQPSTRKSQGSDDNTVKPVLSGHSKI